MASPSSLPKTSIKSPKPSQLPQTHIPKSLKPQTPNPSSKLHQISSLCKQGLLHNAFSLLTQLESHHLPIGPEIYGKLLQGCIYERALSEGQQIHAKIIKNGACYYKNEYIATKLLIFYAKCDCMEVAEEMFLRHSRPNVFSWAAMIGLHSRGGLNDKALVGFCRMIEMGECPDNFVVPNALKACSAVRIVGFGRGVHGYVLKQGFGSCVYVLSSLVDFYGKCGEFEDAKKVFEEMPERNVVTWNSILGGFVQNGIDEEAVRMFYDMRVEGVEPTRVSIANFLSACANLEALDEGRQGHAIALLHGLELDNILGTSIINFYCKVGLIEEAEVVFDCMEDRDEVTWNLMISGYVQDGQIDEALITCHHMRKACLKFDSVTLSSILSACAYSSNLQLGRISHAFCMRNNLESDLSVARSIIDLYASCGKIEYAQKVFDVTLSRDLVLWNTLISAYAQYGMNGEALKLFYQMQLKGVPPNVISWNSVILGFLRNGQVSEAQDMFSQMQINGINRNLMTWVTLIDGLAKNGCGYEVIEVFRLMQSSGLRPNATIIIALLLACSNVSILRYGKEAHGYIMRQRFLPSLPIASSLIDMYYKCGSIILSENVFKTISNMDLPLYNALISRQPSHGQANESSSTV